MHCFVTGGAGFIGSNLIDRLLAEGHTVTAYDNFSSGQSKFLIQAQTHSRFKLVTGDILDPQTLNAAVQGSDFVFHLAANADVRHGTEHPDKDLKINTIGTFNVLEAMRLNGVNRLAFSSTGSVYGEATVIPTPEDAPFPIQTSLYAASKVSGEALIQAYCEGFGFQGWIFRFVSLVGPRYSHGHIFDFLKKLMANPDEIEVLGNGLQKKSYLEVGDCINAMLIAINHPQAQEKVNIFNLGTDEACTVNDSLGWICEKLGLNPLRKYTGGARGWIGDNPLIYLNTKRITALGWQPRYSIKEGVHKTVDYLMDEGRWLRDHR